MIVIEGADGVHTDFDILRQVGRHRGQQPNGLETRVDGQSDAATGEEISLDIECHRALLGRDDRRPLGLLVQALDG